MAKHGRLNLKNAQYSMPADAAAYQVNDTRLRLASRARSAQVKS